MRILIVGAGALGGYFGGRLINAGRDVTFLVRPRRAEQLARAGLIIHSPYGDLTLRDVDMVTAPQLSDKFDLILLGCKSYHFDTAVKEIAPAVGPHTMILPVLNGMRHIDVLRETFGAAAVLGGQTLVSATLGSDGEILHLNDLHSLTFGPIEAGHEEQVLAIARALSGAGFEVQAVPDIAQRMWEKWVIIGTLAGSTCLYRAALGDIIRTPNGRQFMTALLEEICAIAAWNGHPPGESMRTWITSDFLFVEGSLITSSMFRDLESASDVEADHLLGDLLARSEAGPQAATSMTPLAMAYNHLKAYEYRRSHTA